ncbi:hypothetical protein ODZ84_14045 [Chryseobacterium fluminis]|uniref:hypothetical protein n=1 Tax=Chryseobacterium fluminis TaxID=2983606 RepID=UPI00225835CC|nr:hypothetical protein [Chryseobacterium sp. MMS21-Ot14]UZT96344.1 hypothetical protein ODZ84_14045 [Chryseobacterium sp. MMS21-Ot14]
MKYLLLILILISDSFFSQTIELKNKDLIRYYELINKAELAIVDSRLSDANDLYKQAFKILDRPQAKDLYNSMQAALKAGDAKNSYSQFKALKCLGYPFDKSFVINNFKGLEKQIDKCDIKIDLAYKKTLDSLNSIDQENRKLSNGDYAKYQKEIANSDSIASLNLLKLIDNKGFPNEYNIGIGDKSDIVLQKFYLIIWHQLATNIYSSQKVNFSESLDKALNNGKISPQNAAFLYDLNNGTNSFSSLHFNIMGFATSNGTDKPLKDQVVSNTAHTECCFVHVWFFPEKRNEKAIRMVAKINESRKRIGLPDLDSQLVKDEFYLKNKDYIFQGIPVKQEVIEDSNKAEYIKKSLIKL